MLACGRHSTGYKRCSGSWGRDGPSLVDSSLSLAAYFKFTFDTSAVNQCLHKLTVTQRITENLFTPGNITKNLSTPGNICKDFQYTIWGCPVLQELPLSVSKCRIKCHHHLSMYKKCDSQYPVFCFQLSWNCMEDSMGESGLFLTCHFLAFWKHLYQVKW